LHRKRDALYRRRTERYEQQGQFIGEKKRSKRVHEEEWNDHAAAVTQLVSFKARQRHWSAVVGFWGLVLLGMTERPCMSTTNFSRRPFGTFLHEPDESR
jgi:hypothetical protein